MPSPSGPRCPHCEGPVIAGTPAAPFCCPGCAFAYRTLRDAGLLRYYDLREGQTPPAAGPAAPLNWLVPLIERARAAAKDGEVRLALDVQGIHCAACVWLIERLFRRREGALRIDVNPGLGRLQLCYRDGVFQPAEFLGEIARFGYRTGPVHKRADAPLDDLLLRFGLCAAISMNSMIFSASLYFGLSAEGDGRLHALFSWGNLLLCALCVVVGGSVFLSGALRALRRGVVHMDAPIALGIVLSFAGSAWSFLFRDGSAAYFDTVNIFITLMLLGRLLQRRVVSHNQKILLSDEGVDGLYVRRLAPRGDGDGEAGAGRIEVVPAASLRPGDTLLCAPGELNPVDARLGEPRADFSLAWIDGEPEPRPFQAGDTVPAGAHNAGPRAVRLTAAQPFSASALRALLAAPQRPGPGSGAADEAPAGPAIWLRLSRYYVIGVLALAAAAFLLWRHAGTARALEVVVAVLVVTCPCALGLATPLAYELAQARLRRLGLFVRTATFLDRALRVRKVLFDKTGTLTLGELQLDEASQHALAGLPRPHKEALHHMVSRSNHPKSRALLAALARTLRDPPPFDPACEVNEVAGQGLVMKRAGSGGVFSLGRPADPARSEEEDVDLVFAADGVSCATFSFREALRHDARAEVEALQRAGAEIYLLSGDAEARVMRLARHLGLPRDHAFAALSPEGKAALVTRLDRRDTLMIGDGINDAPALAAACCAGTPAVDRPTLPARADFYFLGQGLGPISEALRVAHQVRRVVRRNLALALSYNTLVVALSLAGLMSPVLCALLMPASSLVIVLGTVRGMAAPARPATRRSAARAARPLSTPLHMEAQP